MNLSVTVSSDRRTVTLNHTTPFDESTFYVVRVERLASSDPANFTPAAGLQPRSGNAVNPFTFRTLDTRNPFIESHTPTNNDTFNGGIDTNGVIRVVFNEPMNADSVRAASTIVATTFDGQTIDLKPRVSFNFDSFNTVLTISLNQDQSFPASKSADQPTRITVTVGGTDVVGLPLVANPNVNDTNRNPFTFRVTDRIAPALVSSSPNAQDNTVDPNANITLRFDEPIDPATFRTQSQVTDPREATVVVFQDEDNDGAFDCAGAQPAACEAVVGTVTASFSNNNREVTLDTSTTFGSNARFGVRILGRNDAASDANALRDVTGNLLSDNVTFTFGARESTPPVIVDSNPDNNFGVNDNANANRFDPNSPIILTFSEPINAANFSAQLRRNGSDANIAFTQSFSNNNTVVTITPTVPLETGNNSVFQLTITNAEDISGNDLVGSPTITFRTRDLTGPAVADLNPDNGAQILPSTLQPVAGGTNPPQNIVITLDEPIQTGNNANLPIVAFTYSRAQDDPRPFPPLPRVDPSATHTPAGSADGAFSRTSRQVLYQLNASAVTNGGRTLTIPFQRLMEADQNFEVVENATGANAPLGTDLWAFAPGENVVIQITQALDVNGNQVRQTTTPEPNPFIYTVIDVRPPRVTRIRVGGQDVSAANQPTQNTGESDAAFSARQFATVPLVALAAPIEVTFSKPLSTTVTPNSPGGSPSGTGPIDPTMEGRLTFQADGNYCSSADLVTVDSQGRPTGLIGDANNNGATECNEVNLTTRVNYWRARANAYSSDLRTVTLTHEPFAEANPNDDNVTDRQNGVDGHFFAILNAQDQPQISGQPGQSLRDPATGNLRSSVPGAFGFITTSRPRITNIEFEVARNSDTGDLAGADPDRAGLLGGSRQWVSFNTISPAAAVVPLNTRFRFTFNGQINQATVSPPVFTQTPKPVLGFSSTFNAQSNQVIFATSDLLGSFNQFYVRDADRYVPGGAIYTGLTLTNAVDVKGDPLRPFAPGDANNGVAFAPVNVNPIDVVNPATMTIEYLANINANGQLCVNGTAQNFNADNAQWRPLNGATDVPLNTRFRIRLNETFGPGGVRPASEIALQIVRNGDNGPVPPAPTFVNVAGDPATARQDYNIGNNPAINGGQTIFNLGTLTGSSQGNADNAQGTTTYNLRITAGDTRLDDDGQPAILPDNPVVGNNISQTLSFRTEDRTAPVVRSITGATSRLGTLAPDSPIVVRFDEPVDINTVNIESVDRPSGVATPAFSKAYADNGNDKTTVVFTPTTPLVQPSAGAPNIYTFRIRTVVRDIPTTTRLNCNAASEQGNVAFLNQGAQDQAGNTNSDRFRVSVPVEVTPPTVRSITSTREEITIQFSEPVISSTDANVFGRSAVNANNYRAPFAAAQVGIGTGPRAAGDQQLGQVNYSYFDVNRTALVNGQIVSAPGYVTVTRNIVDIRYNANATAVTLQVQPMVEGQGTNQAEFLYLQVLGNIQDLNANNLANVELQTTVQNGRADWVVQMGVRSNVQGASPDLDSNFFGVRGIAGVAGSASNGLDQTDDIQEPFAPGANHVFIYSSRARNEPGFEGSGGNFASDIQSRPLLNEQRTWRLGVTSDLGVTGAPATITMTWNLNAAGREVPNTHSVELINLNPGPGEPTSIDMRTTNQFTYQVANNGLDATRFFRLEVTAPGVQQSPFQLAEGFNLISVPVRAQNPAVGNVFFGLSPLVLYRYNPETGYEIFPSSATFTTIEPGRGYFVRPRVAGYQIRVLGTPVVGQTTIRLRRGWNLIGNPYNIPVNGANMQIRTGNETISVAEAVRRGLLQDSFVTYDPITRGYTNPEPLSNGTLQPWRGYFVLSFQDLDVIVNKPTTQTTP